MTACVQPVFIVGLPRSGTKLLRALLDNHPALFIPPYETECLPWLVQHMPPGGWQGDAGFSQLWSAIRHLPFFDYLRRDGIEMTEQAWKAHCKTRDAAGVFDGLIRAVAELSGHSGWQCWGDKSPSHIGHIGLIAEQFPGARIIHIVRDVRDVAASARKAWGKSPVRTAQRWRDELLKVRTLTQGADMQFMEVHFEDLVHAPRDTMTAVMHFLGLPFSGALLQLSPGVEDLGSAKGAQSILPQAAGNYRKALDARTLASVERVACDAMQAYGYDCDAWHHPRRGLPAWRMGCLRYVDAVQLVRHRMRTLGLLGAVDFYWRYNRFSGNRVTQRPVLMLGTGFSTRGGIASVVKLYRDSGFFERNRVHYLVTHGDGNVLYKAWAAASAYVRLWWRLLCHRYRLVHVHLSSGPSFYRKHILLKAVRLMGVPYVVHLHGSEFREFYMAATPHRQARIRRLFDRAAAVIALSQDWKSWLQGISENPRTVVIPNTVPVPAHASRRPAGQLLFMGRLGERKGIYTLLDAMVLLKDEFPFVHLVCAGDGEIDAVRQRVAGLGLQSHVEVPGWVGVSQRAEYLQQSAIFVLPSHNEGLPMAILEAMAAGLAVVSTPVGGIPDAVIEGDTGMLVPPGDAPALAAALRYLLANPAEVARYGDAGRARIEQRFSPTVSESRIRALWHQVAP